MRAPYSLLVVLVCVVLPGVFETSGAVGTPRPAGSGPEISVPKDSPPGHAHALPKPNWIDQSADDVLRKSRGCIECHAGVEPMHTSPSVMLGCTDCHGGNA